MNIDHIFLELCKRAEFTPEQIKALRKTIYENAVQLAFSGISTELITAIPKDEMKQIVEDAKEKFTDQKTKEVKQEVLLEIGKKVLQKHMPEEEVENTFDKALKIEYLVSCKFIITQLDPEDSSVKELQEKLTST